LTVLETFIYVKFQNKNLENSRKNVSVFVMMHLQ